MPLVKRQCLQIKCIFNRLNSDSIKLIRSIAYNKIEIEIEVVSILHV